MTTTTTRPRARATVVIAASRAVVAALLAVATTFWPQPDRTAAFGLVALGVFLLLQAAVLAVAARVLRQDRAGRILTAVRSAVSLAGGVIALTGIERGAALLLPLEAVVFLAVGALEFADGMRSRSGDPVVVGGLQVVVGLMLVILSADTLFAIGLLSAWSALVAVYLGIAAAHLRGRGRTA